MGIPIRVLLIDDSEDDAALLLHELGRGGYDPTWERVDTAPALAAALQHGQWDLITCDWVMPQFSAPAALALIRQHGCDLPVIIVSGAVGEEIAVSAMRAGAHDYVSKHKLVRLVPAIERELREVEVRRARRQTEQAYRAVVEESLQGLAIIQGSAMVFANPALARISGVSVAELLQMPVAQMAERIHPAERAEVARRMELLLAGVPIPSRTETRIARKDGSLRWFETHTSRIEYQGKPALQVAFLDVTDRKRAEEALQVSERHFRALIEGALDLIGILNPDGTVRYVNPAHTRLLGYSAEELIGRRVFELVHPEDRQAIVDAFLEGVGEGFTSRSVEFRFRHKDGSWKSFEGVGRNLIADPVIAGVLVNSRDITERKQAEADRARLSAAVEQAAEFIVVTDPDGTIRYVNPAGERLSGYSRDELCGQSPARFVFAPIEPELRQNLRAALARAEVWSGCHVQQRKDGTSCEVELTISPVRDASGQVINYLAIGRDVTHERQLETQLRQAQRLEAIGRLAGGVAHDFNNQLTVIIGSAQFLLTGLAPDDPGRQHVERIAETADHSARLVRQLLTFSRQQPLETRPLQLGNLLAEMAPVLRLLLSEQISLQVSTLSELWPVQADRVQIERVIINLAVNARDALRSRAEPSAHAEASPDATIVISATNVQFEAVPPALSEHLRPGAYVLLGVQDNGPGMEAAVRERIFEPFFTTKDPGHGTGLGLATVFGIITQHGGHITCTSELGRGSTFHIYLPRGQIADLPAPQPHAAQLRPRSPQEPRTVLIAEDEDSVRDVVRLALEESGYRVLVAHAADDAVAAASANGVAVDVLITDMVMPGGSGTKLAQRLSQHHPGMRVLFISGYHNRALDLSALPGARFLQKPFGLDQLLQAVEELLAG
ncbi:MAG: PAS domain S-box protein [Deltaproteobacteria bacterium]|nr:PAS domain S-box protein [Deltaproteobacteria bacterium]